MGTVAYAFNPALSPAGRAPPVPEVFCLTCLARLAIVLQLDTSRAGTRVERLPWGQQAQVGAAAVVLLASRVDW